MKHIDNFRLVILLFDLRLMWIVLDDNKWFVSPNVIYVLSFYVLSFSTTSVLISDGSILMVKYQSSQFQTANILMQARCFHVIKFQSLFNPHQCSSFILKRPICSSSILIFSLLWNLICNYDTWLKITLKDNSIRTKSFTTIVSVDKM